MDKKAEELKKALKNHGYNRRQVTVRSKPCTYSWAFYITVRDDAVSTMKVEQIARGFEDIDRDCATGEILLGGNTYISVQRKRQKPLEVPADFKEIVGEVMKLENDHGLRYGDYVIMKSHYGDGFDISSHYEIPYNKHIDRCSCWTDNDLSNMEGALKYGWECIHEHELDLAQCFA